ncbi:MAG: tetratricopeptide repeat protein [Verrucomicrobiaceae bacterium]|nr:tetratricopeptide repeat protein [Verrucomicrobiaceae bacterium]
MFRTLLAILCLASTCLAQQLDVEKMFEERNLGPVAELLAKGDYELVARIGEAAVEKGLKAADWRIMRFKALAELGQVEAALAEASEALKSYPDNLELLMLRHDLASQQGHDEVKKDSLTRLNAAAKAKAPKDRTALELVSLGRAAVVLGADAQKVIAQYFKAAQTKDAKLEEAYLAEGHLAFEKDDAKRAADVFRAGLKAHGETANLRFGLAKAFSTSDREKAVENLVKVLELNPHHKAAHLLRAELLIGGEKFVEAEKAIQVVLDKDEQHPEAWALRAVVAQLFHADAKKVAEARGEALKRWSKNPAVDHLIGRCLSRAYRFAESAAHQRQALEFDAKYLPAKVQLCHDLLRLGEEEEAWKLAAAVREEDGYNTQAHNLGLLEKEMGGYVTKSFPDFILKMPKRDWPIYGERALSLLREAKAVLAPKYGLDLKRPVLVEFFGAQSDFAIRTFGALGGQGMLGVCFGTVVTMNSPGSLANGRNNWESTLWHEFCHVITLSVTKNRMPRWLSEGISVYEERQRDPSWGMPMDATFREMALDEEKLTPFSQLSGAFMNAKSQDDILFAYYESSQAVEYLLDTYGKEKFQGILRDLAAGKRVNDAIAANCEDVDAIEKRFAAFISGKAKAFGALADWNEPKPEELNPFDDSTFSEFLKTHPTSLWALQRHAEDAIKAKNWPEVLETGKKIASLVPEDFSAEGGHALQVMALREMKREDEEIAVLRRIAAGSSSAQSAFLRLIELDLPKQRWNEVLTNARRVTALNPFLVTAQKALAEANAALNQPAESIQAWERVLILDPGSAAQTHFKLAQLWKPTDTPKARRHLLDSLSLAPRNREGLEMLRQF